MRKKGEDEVGVGLHKLVALLAYLQRTKLSFLTHLTQEKRRSHSNGVVLIAVTSFREKINP